MMFARSASRQLTRMPLVLAPLQQRAGRHTGAALALLAMLAGAAGGHTYAMREPASATPAAALPDRLAPLQRELEASRMSLRVAESRSQELERQIDALNERLREGREELTFLRGAVDGRKRGG